MKQFSDETKAKMRLAKLGKPGYWRGKIRPQKTRDKIRATLKGKFTLDKNPSWKGGRTINRGYVEIKSPEHPFCSKRGYVVEHRLVMEKKVGRFLKPSERVHHINGDRLDNRIENLKLFSSHSEHMKKSHQRPFRNPNNNATHRQCSSCRKILELNTINFIRCASRSLGFGHWCRKCQRKWYRDYRKRFPKRH